MTLLWYCLLSESLPLDFPTQNLTWKKNISPTPHHPWRIYHSLVKLCKIEAGKKWQIMLSILPHCFFCLFWVSIFGCISVLALQQQGKSVFFSVQISIICNTICSINEVFFLKYTLSSFMVLLCHLTHSLICFCMAKISFGYTIFYGNTAFVTIVSLSFESQHFAEIKWFHVGTKYVPAIQHIPSSMSSSQ